MRLVEVVPHNPQWRSAFDREANQIAPIFSDNLVAIHHIGSTAIPTIYAKPILDFLIEATNLAAVDTQNSAMIALCYQPMGEFGIPGRRYFRKENEFSIRTHHVHVFEAGSNHIDRHLAFRDYLIAHPKTAQQYSNLKRHLAAQFPHDIESYMNGKHDFIQTVQKQAIEWRKNLPSSR